MVRLRRVSADQPGWTRRRAGRGFVYLDEHGRRLPEEVRERIQALAIPPAWQDVWICPRDNGHLQAVGTDAAGRRQYLYHPGWRERQDAAKFLRVRELGRAMPRLRAAVQADLDGEGMALARACALAVRLLDLGSFRIGSDVYADENGSFGLTTLRRHHLRRQGELIVFEFTGKSGVEHLVEIDDAAAVAALAELRRRRGGGFEELLAYRDAGPWQRLTPAAVNDYLREASGLPVTAKDFRTWHATVLAAVELARCEESGATAASRKRAVAAALREVSAYLGNTPAVARSSYVDPAVLERYQGGETISRRVGTRAADPQTAIERAVLRLLG